MKKAVAFLSLICSVVAVMSVSANNQRPDQSFYYRQLDNRNGLSNSAINAILQDKNELLWVGTWDGLNRYDGAHFNVYNHNIDQVENSIGSNVIQAISEDRSGNIWINTIGGISRYHQTTGKFYRYFYKNTTAKKVTENEYKLAINEQGEVFCYAADGILSRYDATTDQFVNCQNLTGNNAIVKMQFVLNQLWYLTKNGRLVVASPTKKSLKTIKSFDFKSNVNNFFVVNQQIVLSLNNEEQYLIGHNFEFRALALGNRKIRAITSYQSHYLIAWENQGMGIFDTDFKPSTFLAVEAKKLAGSKITTLSVSRDRILWIGTDGNGLIQVYPKDKYFGLLTKIAGTGIDKPIRAFAEDQGNLWVGTKGNGVLIFNNFWQTGAAKASPEKIDQGSGLENNSVFALKRGIDGLTYIGTDGEGIAVYDHKNKKTINWKNIRGSAQLPDFRSVYAIIQDPDSSIWLGTSGYGLIHLKLGRDRGQALTVKHFKQYYSSETEQNGPANDIIYALAKGKDNRLWIACRYGGLSVFDPKNSSFKTFKAFGYKGSLSHSDVLSLFYDSKERLWIGTSYGLNYLLPAESQKEKPVFGKITMDKGGLPNNTIHAIQEDGEGHIWLSTNKGLAKLNPSNNSIANYQESDGLQSNEFSDGAVFKAANNYLLFGGIYGFNYFMPKEIAENTRQPNLLISDLQLGGREFENNQYLIVKAKQPTFAHFELERKSNFFQFSLNALNYYNASKNEFAYKLKGLDQAWRYTGADGKIAYYNIPPGNYELLVRWSNGEGIWTKDVVALSLHVKQYFWLTYPAYLVYFILLLISGYAFHVYRKNKLEMSFKLERETLFRQKDEEAHRQRINFFTNIAHEIQTPLTLILGSVEHFMQQQQQQKAVDQRYFLSLMHQHTARLTYLVQQLLEFRKAEAGYLKRHDDYVDISKMLHSLTQLFIPAAARNAQHFTRNIPPDIAGFIDKDKYEKILFNLLSNAFKHTGAGAVIEFAVNYDAGTQVLETVVANSGCTLKEADLENIFTEFHIDGKNRFEKFSTGIGLAFTKGLIEVLEGTIEVSLKQDWIYFTVRFALKEHTDHQDEVIASAPSYLFESILKPYQQGITEKIDENNKHSLIDDLQDKTVHSILIVEDDAALRFLLKDILKDQYHVYEAENGLMAIDFLKKNTPDLIISDVMMPDMDGLAFCRYVKTAPAISHIPFIMLSARDGEAHKTEGYETGADAYIPKPFHVNYLQVRVRKLLDYRNRMNNLIKDGHINTQFMDADLDQGDREFLNALVKAVEANLAEPDLDAATLENALAISKMQLYRKLKAIAGMTPSEFIRRIRLKHAAMLLQNSKLTVSEIFYLTGFNNKSYFFREFKKIYHLAPNDYRIKQHTGSTPTNV